MFVLASLLLCTAPATTLAEQAPAPSSAEMVFWQTIANSEDLADFEDYLHRFPNGTFAGLAHRRGAALLQPLAQGGDADAQRELGRWYNRGWVVGSEGSYDPVEAERWFRRAAEQGDVSAQMELASLYSTGAPGVPTDAAEVARWYRRAAEQGDAVAQNNLGVLYRDGKGVPQDGAEALRWLLQAFEQGVDSTVSIGRIYRDGNGVPQDEAEAVRWFQIGAEQDQPFAQCALSQMYEAGRGVPRNPGQAALWSQRAEASGRTVLPGRGDFCQRWRRAWGAK